MTKNSYETFKNVANFEALHRQFLLSMIPEIASIYVQVFAEAKLGTGSREEDGPKRNLLINFSLRLLLLSFVCFFGALFFTFNGSWCMADSSVRPHQFIVFLTGEI